MYCDQRSQYIRFISKKNSFRGNYSRKYGIWIFQGFIVSKKNSCHGLYEEIWYPFFLVKNQLARFLQHWGSFGKGWLSSITNLTTALMSFMLFWFLPISIADGLCWHSCVFKPAYWAVINVGPRPAQITWLDHCILRSMDLTSSIVHELFIFSWLIHSPSKCLVRLGLYGVKLSKQKLACHSHDDAVPLSF